MKDASGAKFGYQFVELVCGIMKTEKDAKS